MDEEGWSRVNSLLRQHGLPPVDVLCVGSGLTPTVVLTTESARVLRQTLMTLMTDGDTRRNILLEMINVNNQLKEELKAQKSVSSRYEDEVKELQADLNDSYARLQELEVRGTSASTSHAEERPKDAVVRSKLLLLQQKCDLYETELNRLTMKLRKISDERSKYTSQGKDFPAQLQKNLWKDSPDGRGDNVYRPKLYRRKEESSQDDGSAILDCSTSTDSENFSALKLEVKSCENSLLETREKLKMLESENEKLKLELLARPQMKDLREAQVQIKKLQNLIESKDRSVSRTDKTKISSPTAEDLPHVTNEVCRKYLKKISEEIGTPDLKLIVPRLEQMKKATEAFPQLELFAREVLSVIEGSDIPLGPGHPHVPSVSGSHQVWCERTWYYVLPTLEFWVTQLKQLKELQLSIKNLAERLFPWKPVKLEDVVTTIRLIELVDSFVWEENENEIARRISCYKIQAEPVTKEMLIGIVQHFQMLFDVPRICGVYAKMSDIYRRLKETHNIFKNLKEILGLEESANCGTVVDAVATLCETRNRDVEHHLGKLFHTDDIQSIVRKIEEQDELLSALTRIINSLMNLLKVDYLDAIIPTVSHLIGAQTPS